MSGHPHQLCGFLEGQALYKVTVPIGDWHRLVELSLEGIEGLPNWIDNGNSQEIGRREILTTDPSYFDRQKEIRNANTGRDQAGFTEL